MSSRTLFFFVLLIALPVASFFLLFKHMNEDIRTKQEKNREKIENLSALAKAEAEYPDRQKEIERLKKAIEFFQSKLPKDKEMDSVLQKIWQQAETNGLSVKSVRLMAVKNGSNYNELPIRVVISGPATGYYKFLRYIEQLNRITHIGEMTIDCDPKVDGNILTDMVLTVYFERSESTPRS